MVERQPIYVKNAHRSYYGSRARRLTSTQNSKLYAVCAHITDNTCRRSARLAGHTSENITADARSLFVILATTDVISGT